MPKVSEKYLEEKKNIIMDGALELIKEIPLYQITMRDIIKKIGCSQGLIYRYYQGVDDIYLDLMNREIKDIEITEKIDEILNSNENESSKISKAFQELGKYILSVQEKIGGKFLYELQVRYVFDEQKQKEVLPELIFKQNLMYFQTAIVNHILNGIDIGIFRPTMPIENIVVYAGATIDGIINHAAIKGQDDIESVEKEVLILFQILSEHVITCIDILEMR